jgi:hypothetical protein
VGNAGSLGRRKVQGGIEADGTGHCDSDWREDKSLLYISGREVTMPLVEEGRS